MFSGCENLTQADFNTLNTENVCYMPDMFKRTSLEEYDLSAFDTRNVEEMCAMFFGCNDAKYINVSSFDTSKVRDMSSMFDGCTDLSAVELGDGWDTGNVSDFAYMFANCTALTELDIENFEFYSLETMEGILDNCPNYRYSTELLFVMVASGEIGFGLNDGAAEVVQSVEEESIYLYQGCGDRKNVVAIQQKLIEMGYLNDVADGVFGGNTKRAVEAFQQVYGLPVTGEVDNELYHRILGANSDDETEAVYEEVSGSGEMPGGYGATGTFTLLVPSMDNLYYLTIIEGMEHAAAEYGFELVVISCNYYAEMQMAHLELQLAEGTDALFLCPTDDEVCFVAEELAAECGIPLFLFDAEGNNEGTFSLLHDEFRGGYICGEEYAKDHPDGGKVALVAASSSFEERESGFSQAVADSGVNIEEMKMALESNSAEECALSLIELLLNVDDVSAIFCRGELEAQAAVRACEITGKQIPIYAVGGSEDMKTLVEQGKIDTIAAQSPLAMGRIAVDLYGSWLHGENYAGNHYIDFLMINSETLGNYGVAGWQ